MKYSNEFKEQIVHKVLSGKTVKDVAIDNGVGL